LEGDHAVSSGPALTSELADFDVAVVGAGVGGVTAAVRAAEGGARVLLIEAGPRLGGTAAYSGGMIHIWGSKTWDEYRRMCPTADPVLARAFFDGYQPYIDWLLASGGPGHFDTFTPVGHVVTGYQIGGGFEPHRKLAWFDYCGDYVEQHGGRVLFGARATDLISRDGRVVGLTGETLQGTFSVLCASVVLAAGGFQNDPELLTRYLGDGAGDIVRRSVEYNRGDGLRMALRAGAAATGSMDTVYGHLMPTLPLKLDWTNYLDPIMLSAGYAEHAMLVNVDGTRFVDEGADLAGLTANAALEQPSGGVWLIMDDAIRRDYTRYEIPWRNMHPSSLRHWRLLRYFRPVRRAGRRIVAVDSMRLARDRGALVIQASSIAELCRKLGEHGVAPETLQTTIADFNDALARDEGAALVPPRVTCGHLLTEPPFLAMKVAAGVSMTYGGVAINPQAEALDPDGRPIPGLYAVPGTAGGVHHLHYGGSLAACGVFGFIAGEQVAHRRLKESSS
jgi:succinate dehydrogenase/fumarate reductase flavoprotein subunit